MLLFSLTTLEKPVGPVNECTFRARPLVLFGLGAVAAFCLWPVIFGVGESYPINAGLDIFLLLTVSPRLVFLCMAGFVGATALILYRLFIRITPEAVEYFDGWRTRRRIPRSHIVAAEVRHPGAILVVRCVDQKDNFSVPLIAYSRAGLLTALLQRSAMEM